MSGSNVPISTLLELGMTKKDILALDPMLFSADLKKAYIDLLYGNPSAWTWKQDLNLVAENLHRWRALLTEEAVSGDLFRVGPKRLIEMARHCPPKMVGSSVTDFTDWIFRLYVPVRDQKSLLRGQRIEREIAMQRIPIPEHSRWKLIYNGMSYSDSKALQISELKINGVPMRGKPDLVFREKDTKKILIVEIKASDAVAPLDGWPNMRAQLWAYSKIDEWRDASEIILVGEIWGFMNGVRLRKAIRWRKGDEKFEHENAALFDCYTHMDSN